MKRFGVSNYEAAYEKRFADNLNRYGAMRKSIKRRVDRILEDPYHNTETLGDISGKLNLVGLSQRTRRQELQGHFRNL